MARLEIFGSPVTMNLPDKALVNIQNCAYFQDLVYAVVLA
jgi:hypothetical protein